MTVLYMEICGFTQHANLYTIVFLYKRAKNAPKRKISAQVIPDIRPLVVDFAFLKIWSPYMQIMMEQGTTQHQI